MRSRASQLKESKALRKSSLKTVAGARLHNIRSIDGIFSNGVPGNKTSLVRMDQEGNEITNLEGWTLREFLDE
jgi:hypothetical protein